MSILFSAVLAELPSYLIVAAAGIAFPFVQKRLFESSAFRRYIGPVPAWCIVAVLALAVYGLFTYSLATTEALGANSKTGWWAIGIIAAISVSVYPVSYAINKARGIDQRGQIIPGVNDAGQ